jgi:drug/metabolite transporter (DMT)-like permease
VQGAFAAGAVEGKLALEPLARGGGGVDPIALAMARMVGAALFFQAVARGGASLRPLPLREHGRIAGLSILGIVLNQTLYLVGLRITTAFSAALLAVTIPVFTAALAVVFRVEPPRARTGLGLALALAGVLFLTGIRSVDLGALVIAANCFSYALYIVFSKRVVEREGAVTVITWLFTWGALLLAPLGAWPLVRGATTWSVHAWALVIFMIVCPTIIAYFANAWALGRATPTLVTVYITLQPVLAALLQWVQLGTPVTWRALAASAFILVGVTVVASRHARWRPLARSSQ